MGDITVWIAALVLHTGDGGTLESTIMAPTQDGCALQVQAWLDDAAANMLRIYDGSWVDMTRAECAMISAEPPWEIAVPPPAMTPERDHAPQ